MYNRIIESIQLNSMQCIKMGTIFMNYEKSKTPMPHVLTLKLTSKLDLRIGEKFIALSNLSIYYTWRNIKSSYNDNRFKISAPTWNDEFELPDESYSVSDIQDYFKYILKNIGKILINHQYKYMWTKFKIVLHLKLKMDIALKN